MSDRRDDRYDDGYDDGCAGTATRIGTLMHERADELRPDLTARAEGAVRVGRRIRRRRRAVSALGVAAVLAAVGSVGYLVVADGAPTSSAPTGFAGQPSSPPGPSVGGVPLVAMVRPHATTSPSPSSTLCLTPVGATPGDAASRCIRTAVPLRLALTPTEAGARERHQGPTASSTGPPLHAVPR